MCQTSIAAADFLKLEFEAPKLLIGHSLGGAAVLQAAKYIPSSIAVATIGAPSNLTHLARYLKPQQNALATGEEAEITLAGKTFRVKKQFLDDLELVSMHETIHDLNKALLLFHSPVDSIVGIENAAEIFQAARHPKSFISLDRADHLLSNREDSLYVGSVLAAWARKYLEIPRPRVLEEIRRTTG